MADELTPERLDDDGGLDGFTWAELVWMGNFYGDPKRAREALTPSEARAAYLRQEQEWAEHHERKAQEAQRRLQDADVSPTHRALDEMVVDDSRRYARQARATIRSIHPWRLCAYRQPARVGARARERRTRVARRVARTSARGDPPHPGSDDDPHDVAVAPLGVAA